MRGAPLACGLLVLLAGCVASGPDEDGELDFSRTADASTPEAPAEPVKGFDWSKPHVHDYWGRETSRVLMDDPVRVYVAHNHLFDQPPRELHTHGCEGALVSRSQGGSVVFTLPPSQTVIPGTDHVEVVIDWASSSVTGVLVRYRSPDVSEFAEAGVAEPGEPLIIPTTRPMADQGHERRSRWDFALCAWSGGGNPVDLAEGSVNMRVTIHRVDGPLPLDPGHPDPWGATDSLLLGRASWSGEALAAGWAGQDDWTRLEMEGLVPWDADGVRFSCHANLTGAPEEPVVEAWYSSPARETEWAFRHAVLNATPEGTFEAVVPIQADQTDGVYGEASHWEVWLRLRGTTSRTMASGLGVWALPEHVEGDIACRMDAWRA